MVNLRMRSSFANRVNCKFPNMFLDHSSWSSFHFTIELYYPVLLSQLTDAKQTSMVSEHNAHTTLIGTRKITFNLLIFPKKRLYEISGMIRDRSRVSFAPATS